MKKDYNELLINNLENLGKEELINLIIHYDQYISVDHEEEFVVLDRCPVCVAEFIDYEWEMYSEECDKNNER